MAVAVDGCDRPWQHRSWIFPRDPDFAAKAGRVLDLYHRRWANKPLKPDEYVISADEKTSISRPAAAATPRCHQRQVDRYVSSTPWRAG